MQGEIERLRQQVDETDEQLQRRDAEIGALKIKLGKIIEIARKA